MTMVHFRCTGSAQIVKFQYDFFAPYSCENEINSDAPTIWPGTQVPLIFPFDFRNGAFKGDYFGRVPLRWLKYGAFNAHDTTFTFQSLCFHHWNIHEWRRIFFCSLYIFKSLLSGRTKEIKSNWCFLNKFAVPVYYLVHFDYDSG